DLVVGRLHDASGFGKHSLLQYIRVLDKGFGERSLIAVFHGILQFLRPLVLLLLEQVQVLHTHSVLSPNLLARAAMKLNKPLPFGSGLGSGVVAGSGAGSSRCTISFSRDARLSMSIGPC